MITEYKIKEIIEDVVGVCPNLTDTSETLGLDSLDVITIIMDIEKEFAIYIPDDDIRKIISVQDMVTYVNKKIVQSPSGIK